MSDPSPHVEPPWVCFSGNMGSQKKWSMASRSPFATMRGRLGPRKKGVESLCVSSLLGVLRSHTWLIGDEDVALLLARTSSPCFPHPRAHSLSFSLCSSSADGGSDDFGDPRSPSLDPHLSHIGQGKQFLFTLFLPVFLSISFPFLLPWYLRWRISLSFGLLGCILLSFIAKEFTTAENEVILIATELHEFYVPVILSVNLSFFPGKQAVYCRGLNVWPLLEILWAIKILCSPVPPPLHILN